MGKEEEYSSLVAFSGDYLVNITVMLLIVIGGIGFLVSSKRLPKILLPWLPRKFAQTKISITAKVVVFAGVG